MNGVRGGKAAGVPQLKCSHAGCGATFSKQIRLQEHEAAHAGKHAWRCTVSGCDGRFTRKSRLSRHMLQHDGAKQFRCKFATCTKSFFHGDKLKRHMCYAHGEKDKYFKCTQDGCSLTFKKRCLFKLHQQEHGVAAKFKCSKEDCGAVFDSHVARKAHEKKHAGYRCLNANCQVVESTWVKLQKHMVQHQATFTCHVCKKVFKSANTLRRHKRVHASHKPVLVCPRESCQAYFSTTFNLQHHIRKVHLGLLKYKCSFPDCPRIFAMRESMSRHLLRHDLSAIRQKTHPRPRKSWQKRLDGHHLPLVEDNLNRLFALRMHISRRAKVEVNLSGLFNERKIPHYVDPEVNLRDLFSIKKSLPPVSEVAPLKG
ncbi:P43 5S RNA-binding protein-like isoform X1 [Dunckerocampus dactyliophorus]|uniref:P43 5S RNA-binding protein-like isoform X1 n=2 Tax=Dunckerocampus dactyliophorus TaxID=161453 RepID=UPI002407398C|nr:P43 5S RNA-binding protein-like isoform X1 [Dunckerocampus dactyliophorus]